MPKSEASPARRGWRSLAGHFAGPAGRGEESAAAVLAALVEAVAPALSVLELTPDTIQVSGDGRAIGISGDAGSSAMYCPPELDPEPWQGNQYKVGLSMCVALSGRPDLGSHEAPDSDYWRAWNASEVAPRCIPASYSIPFREAIATMLREPSDRFPDPELALRAIRRIRTRRSGAGRLLQACVWACLILALTFAALAFVPDGRRAGTEYAPDTPTLSAPVALPKVVVAATSPRLSRPGLALVSGGAVLLGGAPATVEPFLLDRLPVSIGQYERWARAAEARLPYPGGREAGTGGPSLPVWNVSWKDAAGFCAGQGKHLPTEAEWQRAWDLNAAGAEGVAVVDLNGMPEWTADAAIGAGADERMVRGGRSYLPAGLMGQRFSMPAALDPGRGLLRVSFRCAAAWEERGTKGGN